MFGKLLILLALAALAVGVVAHTSSGAGPERNYVVKPADTLWSISARTYAGDTREGVWRRLPIVPRRGRGAHRAAPFALRACTAPA